jgi:nitroreductase
MIGRLRQAALHYGERSYRDVLIEAGRIGERVYLAAEALDLRARNLAAFLDEDLDELIGADGRERSVVHLTMVGYTA